MITKNKGLAYIFRENRGAIELLVFDHRDYPKVNPQVPAGTVDDNESFEHAVIREVYEESGLKLEQHSQYIGCFDYRRTDLKQLHKRHIFSFYSTNLPDTWEHIVSDGAEDKGLVFDYYWLSVEDARFKLVADMGSYLPEYLFKPLIEPDLPIIEKWLQKSHVKEFWDDGESWEKTYEKYVLRTSSDAVKQFLVYLKNQPIGYIQFYWASKVGDGWWEGYPDDVVGIDQYIGDEKLIGKGHGTKMIKSFISYISKNHKVSKIITDPSPSNSRVIRCYEKVGFNKVREIETPDGKEILMEYLL